MARGVIDERVRDAYVAIIKAVNDIAVRWTGRRIPILLHGYGFPVPDGRGFAGGFWILPGPWLEPGFRQKGYVDDENNLELQRCTDLMAILIERFNTMLQSSRRYPSSVG